MKEKIREALIVGGGLACLVISAVDEEYGKVPHPIWPGWLLALNIAGFACVVCGLLLFVEHPTRVLRWFVKQLNRAGRSLHLLGRAEVRHDVLATLARSPASLLNVREGRLARSALYAGWFGALGATVGWAFWVAGAAALKQPIQALTAAVVGGVIGAVISLVEHYRSSGRRDRQVEKGGNHPRHRRQVPGKSILLAATVGFFFRSVIEDTSADLIKAVYVPFFTSILIYLPAAIIIGLVIKRGDDEIRVLALLFGFVGFPLGFLVGLISYAIQKQFDNTVSLSATTGWWILICVSATYLRAMRIRGAFLAAGVVLFAALIASWGLSEPTEVTQYKVILKYRYPYDVATKFATTISEAPDLPARQWSLAEAQLSTATLTPAQDAAMSTHIRVWLSCDSFSPVVSNENPASYVERKEKFCQSMKQGWVSGPIRSLVVVFTFLLGLGLAPAIDGRLCPENYASSAMRTYDKYALIATVLLVAAIVLTRAVIAR